MSYTNESTEDLVKQFFKNGGTVTKCEKYARTPTEEIEYTVGWGKKRKKVVDDKSK